MCRFQLALAISHHEWAQEIVNVRCAGLALRAQNSVTGHPRCPPDGSERLVGHSSTTRLPLLLSYAMTRSGSGPVIQAHSGKTRRANRRSACAESRCPLHTPQPWLHRRSGAGAEAKSVDRETFTWAAPWRASRSLKKNLPYQQTRLTALDMKGYHQQRNGRQLRVRPPGRESQRCAKEDAR